LSARACRRRRTWRRGGAGSLDRSSRGQSRIEKIGLFAHFCRNRLSYGDSNRGYELVRPFGICRLFDHSILKANSSRFRPLFTQFARANSVSSKLSAHPEKDSARGGAGPPVLRLRRERALARTRHWYRQARPLARGGRLGTGPTARPPRVAAGILARIVDPRPGHAQHDCSPATAVAPASLGHRGHGRASSAVLPPLIASRPTEQSPSPAPALAIFK